eukprot:CAMPEP_0172535374 /NCGR_PEP_ID=MMETSP1067-20121228/7414_1 /TAXON_ID=265564 ORGANISM="Thalassiosira punctigera, Strain Tpunct2005C2" /NCGR_SAMPLE_ID=MMETSP1067 /ASSEMBLY_ACC=CAM_ASM_000444 /LENGTH=274 /DNA_ID=CAMNT_0013320307 /DNA_START=189 /DNA_END=1013 /DNA_ORIENTATION=+
MSNTKMEKNEALSHAKQEAREWKAKSAQSADEARKLGEAAPKKSRRKPGSIVPMKIPPTNAATLMSCMVVLLAVVVYHHVTEGGFGRIDHRCQSATSVREYLSRKECAGVSEDGAVLGFDDLTTAYANIFPLRDGYKGLNWTGLRVTHRVNIPPTTGVHYGFTSGDYQAANYYGRPWTVSSSVPFSVAGFNAVPAWNKGLEYVVESYDDEGNLLDHYETVLGDPLDGPKFIDLGRSEGRFQNMHELRVRASGGVNAGRGGSDSTIVGIDDMIIY